MAVDALLCCCPIRHRIDGDGHVELLTLADDSCICCICAALCPFAVALGEIVCHSQAEHPQLLRRHWNCQSLCMNNRISVGVLPLYPLTGSHEALCLKHWHLDQHRMQVKEDKVQLEAAESSNSTRPRSQAKQPMMARLVMTMAPAM